MRRHAGTALGSIDTGSFLLAWASLLDGHRATTHWESLDSFAEQFPKVDVGSGLFIIDRSRFTCAGGTAALDMMLHLIRLRHGQQLAGAVSDQFIHAKIRDPQERQRMEPEAREGISRRGFARAIELIASGKVDLKPLISGTFPFEQSVEAFERAASARPGDVKLQIKMPAIAGAG